MAFSTYKGYYKFWWQYNGRTLAAAIALPRGFETGNAYPMVVSLHGSGEVGNDNVGNLSGSVANLSTFWNNTTASYESLPAAFVLQPQMSNDAYDTTIYFTQGIGKYHSGGEYASGFRVQAILALVRGLMAGTTIVYEDAECAVEGTLPFAITNIDDDRVMLTGFSLGAITGWTLLREGRDIWARAMMLEGQAIGAAYATPSADEIARMTLEMGRCNHIPTLLAAQDGTLTMLDAMTAAHTAIGAGHYFVTASGDHVQCPGHAWDITETFDAADTSLQSWGTATGGTRISGLAWLLEGDRSTLTMGDDPYPYDAVDWVVTDSDEIDVTVSADGSQVYQLIGDNEKTLTITAFGTEYTAAFEDRSFAVGPLSGDPSYIVTTYVDDDLTFHKRLTLRWLAEGSDFIEILTEVYNMPVSGTEDVFYIINRGDATDGSDDNSGSSLSPTPDWSGTITLTNGSVTVTKTGDDFPVDGSLWGQWLYAAGATAGKRMHKILSNDATTLTIEKAATEDYTGTAVIGGALATIDCTFDPSRFPMISSSGIFHRSQTFWLRGEFFPEIYDSTYTHAYTRRYVGYSQEPGDGGITSSGVVGATVEGSIAFTTANTSGYLVWQNITGAIAITGINRNATGSEIEVIFSDCDLTNVYVGWDTTRGSTAIARNCILRDCGLARHLLMAMHGCVSFGAVRCKSASDSIIYDNAQHTTSYISHAVNTYIGGTTANGGIFDAAIIGTPQPGVNVFGCARETASAAVDDHNRRRLAGGDPNDGMVVAEFDPTKINPHLLNYARTLLISGNPTSYCSIGPVAPRIPVNLIHKPALMRRMCASPSDFA